MTASVIDITSGYVTRRRTALKLTMNELATKACVSRAFVDLMERGAPIPALKKRAILNALSREEKRVLKRAREILGAS